MPTRRSCFIGCAEKQAPLSAEHVLSGSGLARAASTRCIPALLKLKPEMIVRQARAGDRDARATIAMFVRLFGRFAGDMALAFRATGGVYIAGGVAAGLGPLFDARLFRAAFERHPPYEIDAEGDPVGADHLRRAGTDRLRRGGGAVDADLISCPPPARGERRSTERSEGDRGGRTAHAPHPARAFALAALRGSEDLPYPSPISASASTCIAPIAHRSSTAPRA